MMETPGIGLPRRTSAQFVEEYVAADYPNVQSVIRIEHCLIGVRPDRPCPIRIYTKPADDGVTPVIEAIQIDFQDWVLVPREQAWKRGLEQSPDLTAAVEWTKDGPHHTLEVEDRSGTRWPIAHFPPGPWEFWAHAYRAPEGELRVSIDLKMRGWL